MKSMTGFGSAVAENLFSVEIVSYNSKRLDVSVDMPAALFSIEVALRKRVTQRLTRGAVRVKIQFSERPKEKLADLKEKMESLAKDLGYSESLSFSELLSIMRVQEEFNPEWEEPLMKALDAALNKLIEFREREGKPLGEELSSYLQTLKKGVQELETLANQTKQQVQESIERKLKELKIELSDETRLVQEAFFLGEKRDVSEELSRLRSHLVQFANWLEKEESKGKILGFLLQEILREFNTVGAKTPSVEVVNLALQMRGVAEKMREQVQNVE